MPGIACWLEDGRLRHPCLQLPQTRLRGISNAKNDRPVPVRKCTSPVRQQYDIGQRAGLTGTPMIVTEQGVQMPGYMPPDALRAALDKLAAEEGEGAAAGSR